MSKKTDELLAVRDMPPKEQRYWLRERKIIHEYESFADLAFRLNEGKIAGKNQ